MIDNRLLDRAASSLAGERVKVRIRGTVVVGGKGESVRDQNGQAYINLDPKLDGDALLWVLAHECAHLKLKHVKPSEYAHAKPGALRSPRIAAYVASLPREDDCDKMADEWAKYANDNAHRYKGDRLEAQLSALEFLPYAKLIDDASTKAADTVLRKLGLKRG